MKLGLKIVSLLLLMPAALFAQAGLRMSADFLPLEVGNRWVYDVFNEGGQKIGSLDFAIQDRRIVEGGSFYAVNGFPFIADGSEPVKLIRYDREERQYVKIVDNREDPLFLADGAQVQVLQADSSGLPQKFLVKMDLMDLTFQRGVGIVEARLHAGKDVQVVKLASVHTGEQQAVQAAAQGAPTLPQPTAPATPQPKIKTLADNVAKPSEENPSLNVQVAEGPDGTKFILTILNTSEKLLPFNFKSSQTYDFQVLDASTGQEIWRWSRRMFFSQVVRQEAILGSKNWVFEATWNRRDNDLNVVPPGQYKVIGILATQPPMETDPVSFDLK